MHVFARRIVAGSILLTLFYLLMITFFWPVVFVAILGLIEHMAGIRHRILSTVKED